MDETLTIDQQRDGDICLVHPVGEVDMQTMRPFRELMNRLPQEGVRYIVADLRDVSFMDSAGMSPLFAAKKHMDETGGACYVVSRADGFVAKTLDTIAIDKVMPHLHDPEEALAEIRRLKEP